MDHVQYIVGFVLQGELYAEFPQLEKSSGQCNSNRLRHMCCNERWGTGSQSFRLPKRPSSYQREPLLTQ